MEMQGVRTLYLAHEVTCTCLIRPSTCLIRFSVAYSILPPIFLLISYFLIDSSSIVLIYIYLFIVIYLVLYLNILLLTYLIELYVLFKISRKEDLLGNGLIVVLLELY